MGFLIIIGFLIYLTFDLNIRTMEYTLANPPLLFGILMFFVLLILFLRFRPRKKLSFDKQPYKEIHGVKDKKKTLQRYYGNEDVMVVTERILLDDRVILFVPFKEQKFVEMMGAKFDQDIEKYCIPAIWDITPFASWILPESFLHEKINTGDGK